MKKALSFLLAILMMAACVLAVSASDFKAAYALNNKAVVGAAQKTWDKAVADLNK